MNNQESILRSVFGDPDPLTSTETILRFGTVSLNLGTGKLFDYADDREMTLAEVVARQKSIGPNEAATFIEGFEFPGDKPIEQPRAVPPWLETESYLISILSASPDLVDHVVEDVVPSDFAHDLHARLYLFYQDALVNGSDITAAGIAETLGLGWKDDLFGGFTVGAYLAHLIANSPRLSRDDLITEAIAAAKEIKRQADEDNGIEPEKEPEPYIPKFGAVHWKDMHSAKGTRYDYWIEGVIPERESVLIYGESQSGKSFLSMHMAMCIARGVPFFDRQVTQGLMIYCAVEAGEGFFQLRMPGYEKYHQIPKGEQIPFVCFPKKFDLYNSDTDVMDLIRDIEHVKKMYSVPFAATVIDTYNKATPGLDEISGKDVSKVVHRIDMIRSATQGGVWLVHHKNAAGSGPRGHTSLYAGFETALEVSRDKETKDFNKREIRSVKNAKQREGEDGSKWDFVLQGIQLGIVNQYGRPVFSAVVEEPQESEVPTRKFKPGAGGYVIKSMRTRLIFRCLLEAIRLHGEKPAPGVKVPAGVGLVVHRDRWRDVLMSKAETGQDDPKKRAESVRKAIQRASEAFAEWGIAGVDYPWIWRTAKSVEGFHDTVFSFDLFDKVEDKPPPDDIR
jgi:hypothetical protein